VEISKLKPYQQRRPFAAIRSRAEPSGGGSAFDLPKPECLSPLLIFACWGDDLLDDLGLGVG
jgi:hypothetical protein